MISGLWQKLGFWPKSLLKLWKSKTNWIWFHAVSVGEINAVWPLILEIKKLRGQGQGQYPIMLSCTTKLGYEHAKSLSLSLSISSGNEITIFYFPFDIPFIIQKFLTRAKIKLLIIVETEIWPNLLTECRKQKIPVRLVNARLSDRSYQNYHLLKFYFNRVINSFSEIFPQSDSDAEKFINLGFEKSKIKVLGNLKFSGALLNGKYNSNDDKKKKEIINIIFASTHNGEEELALLVFKELVSSFNNIRLIIAPRHTDRTNEIYSLIKKYNFTPILKTENKECNSSNDILILNTIGELKNYYQISQITVLGGTFAKIGGHNILEPISASSYTIIGPYDFKISELTKPFKEHEAIIQVNNKEELVSQIKQAIINNELRENTVKNGINIIKKNANVLKLTTEKILTYL